VLKTHWLGGKCNWCVDHFIHIITNDFLPSFQIWHKRQIARLEGLDLEGQHRRNILSSTRNISRDSIHQVDSTTFFVAFQSRLGVQYPINLTQCTCSCSDFPRIRYRKHIAAVNVHFPRLCPKSSSGPEVPERVSALDRSLCAPQSESVDILLKDINALCQQLNAVSDDSTPDLQAL
jgi:hypothetical protein